MEEYCKTFNSFVESLKDASSIASDGAIKIFNESYIRNKYRIATQPLTKNTGGRHIRYDRVTEPDEFSTIAEYMLRHPIHEKLGLTLTDMWNMDIVHYNKLIQVLRKKQPKEDSILKDLEKDRKKLK